MSRISLYLYSNYSRICLYILGHGGALHLKGESGRKIQPIETFALQAAKEMKTYKVDKMTVTFNTEPVREFMMKYFGIIYYLSCGKIIIRYHLHGNGEISKYCRFPTALELDENRLNLIPSALPTTYPHEINYKFL